MNHIMSRFVRKIYYPFFFFLPSGEQEREGKKRKDSTKGNTLRIIPVVEDQHVEEY